MSARDAGRPPDYWLTLATEDLAGATAILTMPGTQPRHSVDLASQAAEKALKAAAAAAGIDPPRSHDLVALAHRARGAVHVTVSDHDLRRLSDAHTQSRYPSSPADVFGASEARELAEIAGQVVAQAVGALRP